MIKHSHKYLTLLINDDDRLGKLTKEYLIHNEFNVVATRWHERIASLAHEHQPSLVIIDMIARQFNEREMCQRIRGISSAPILVLDTDMSFHSRGFEPNADANQGEAIRVTPRALLTSAQALLSRQPVMHIPNLNGDWNTLVFGKLAISPSNRSVTWRGEVVDLEIAEFNLLLVLARSAGIILRRDEILKKLNNMKFNGMANAVDVGISKLRRYFEDTSPEPDKIRTIWGYGYQFSPSSWD
ncbi:winged helix-turn-helix domain-containing protein [Burkholderia cepacia]|uniref:winged helix-turn-helix domain-containing protein n=1 Tax=Burkholderia cepacia TaxID=292 RepID=UPI002FE197D2